MRVAGKSNNSIRDRTSANREDRKAWAQEPENPSRVDVTSQEIGNELANVMMSELERTCRLA